jgi:hypothetical protein
MNIEDAMFTSHFRPTMGEVMTGAEQLKGRPNARRVLRSLGTRRRRGDAQSGHRHQGDGCSRTRDGGKRRWHVGTAEHRGCGARSRHSA